MWFTLWICATFFCIISALFPSADGAHTHRHTHMFNPPWPGPPTGNPAGIHTRSLQLLDHDGWDGVLAGWGGQQSRAYTGHGHIAVDLDHCISMTAWKRTRGTLINEGIVGRPCMSLVLYGPVEAKANAGFMTSTADLKSNYFVELELALHLFYNRVYGTVSDCLRKMLMCDGSNWNRRLVSSYIVERQRKQ